jgi:hypothetical protein
LYINYALCYHHIDHWLYMIMFYVTWLASYPIALWLWINKTYVCMNVRMYVFMHVWMYVCMYICMYVHKYVYIYVVLLPGNFSNIKIILVTEAEIKSTLQSLKPRHSSGYDKILKSCACLISHPLSYFKLWPFWYII